MKDYEFLKNTSLYYVKYNIIPNYISFTLAYAYFNNIKLENSLEYYCDDLLKLFNLDIKDIKYLFNIVNKILIDKYNLMIIKCDKLEIINLTTEH